MRNKDVAYLAGLMDVLAETINDETKAEERITELEAEVARLRAKLAEPIAEIEIRSGEESWIEVVILGRFEHCIFAIEDRQSAIDLVEAINAAAANRAEVA